VLLIGVVTPASSRHRSRPSADGRRYALAISALRPGADCRYDRECVVKAPQGAAVALANGSLEPTMCKKSQALRRETGRMSMALSR
jgi:hypothetical protein